MRVLECVCASLASACLSSNKVSFSMFLLVDLKNDPTLFVCFVPSMETPSSFSSTPHPAPPAPPPPYLEAEMHGSTCAPSRTRIFLSFSLLLRPLFLLPAARGIRSVSFQPLIAHVPSSLHVTNGFCRHTFLASVCARRHFSTTDSSSLCLSAGRPAG